MGSVNNSAYPQYNQSFDLEPEADASPPRSISCSHVCAYRPLCIQSWDLVLLLTIVSDRVSRGLIAQAYQALTSVIDARQRIRQLFCFCPAPRFGRSQMILPTF
jgi:hypothetical protein